MNKDLPVYELDIDDLDELSGINVVSAVSRPAIEVGFVKLSEDVRIKLSTDGEKQIATGPVLLPGKPIYRNQDGREFYIQFSADAVERIRNRFFKSSGNLRLSNLQHDQEQTIEGYLVESWLVTDPVHDKSVALGYTDLPVGTLMMSYHFPDKDVWEQVTQMSGWSLEGSFTMLESKLSTDEQSDSVEAILEDILKFLGDGNAQ